jgi:hypothetical protein
MSQKQVKLWTVEVQVDGEYLPTQLEVSRDKARALQRYIKTTKAFQKSRIRRYFQDPLSRG